MQYVCSALPRSCIELCSTRFHIAAIERQPTGSCACRRAAKRWPREHAVGSAWQAGTAPTNAVRGAPPAAAAPAERHSALLARHRALEDWSQWLADRGLSPKTRWNVLAAFRCFIGWLYRREEIRELPREYPWPKPPEATPALISARTQDQILDAIPEERRGIYLAMALMGIRPGEAVALDASDYHDGWLTVSCARKGDRLDSPIRSTKTGKVKRLPVPEELQRWIETHVPPERRLRGEPLFVLPWSGRGLRPKGRWSGSSLRHTWITACKKVGVPLSLYVGTKRRFATDAAARECSEKSASTSRS